MAYRVAHEDVTVVSFTIVNPHGPLSYRTRDLDGSEHEWVAELPALNRMLRFGLTADLFKPGDVVRSRATQGKTARRCCT